ncbi:MAG: tetratricopeptide repeat protein [Anaerolineae bacterium]|nr:tetratricopeptide repeat protein [Anaerolineae bacterium]
MASIRSHLRTKLAAVLLAAIAFLYFSAPWLTSLARSELGGVALHRGLALMEERPSEPNPYLDRALRHFQAAVASNDANAHAWRQLGELYLVLGQNEEARQALSRAVMLRPSFPLYHVLLGDAYDGLGAAREAIDTWREGRGGILRRDQIAANACKIADAHIQAGDPLSAVPVLRDEVLPVDPDNLFALAYIVSTYDGAVSGPHPLADPYRESAVYPPPGGFRVSSDARLAAFQARGAVRLYSAGYWDAGLMVNTIRYWASQGHPAAVMAARELWQSAPEDETWLLAYAEALVRSGLHQEALTLLEEGAAGSPGVLRWRALAWVEAARRGDRDEYWRGAREALLAYRAAAPDDLWPLAVLPQVCQRLGAPEEAERWQADLKRRTEDADREAVAEALQVEAEAVRLGANLVLNGGFELWAGDRPEHWTWSNMATGDPWNLAFYAGGPEEVQALLGASARVQGIWRQERQDREPARAGYWLYDQSARALRELKVTPGLTYVVSLDYFTEVGGAVQPTVWLSYADSPCWAGDRRLAPTEGEWRHFTFVCGPAAEGDDPLRPLLRLFGTGTVLFDNLAVREVILAGEQEGG